MSKAIDPLLVFVLLLNFFALGTTRVRAAIRAVAAQGALLGVLAVFVHGAFGARTLGIAVGTVAIKGFVIPWFLHRAMRETLVRREVEPYIGPSVSLLVGAVATAAAILFSSTLPLASEHAGTLYVPAAIATLLVGFVVLTTRRKAITQVVGYLLIENGIFVMGLTMIEAIPSLVEIGVLLDLFVAVLVMGIVIAYIGRENASLDSASLSNLKEE